ncbi:hypothetical protein M8745_20705, partial [Lutimaribacter sp. EGI FJ00014]|nr:hypothetical protein [Lutimaribacter sp. EGI FJ00014]
MRKSVRRERVDRVPKLILLNISKSGVVTKVALQNALKITASRKAPATVTKGRATFTETKKIRKGLPCRVLTLKKGPEG